MIYKSYKLIKHAIEALHELDPNIIVSIQEINRKRHAAKIVTSVVGHIVMDKKGKFIRQLAGLKENPPLFELDTREDKAMIITLIAAFLWNVHEDISPMYAE